MFVKDREVFADGRDVATLFEKRHDNVLFSIDTLLRAAPDLAQREFTAAKYGTGGTMQDLALKNKESNESKYMGPSYRCFHMSRDGFVFLAMGFNCERVP